MKYYLLKLMFFHYCIDGKVKSLFIYVYSLKPIHNKKHNRDSKTHFW